MGSTSSKVCVVCGTDCSHTPRVKDPRGRYFCKPCYEEALARKKAGGSAHDSHSDHDDGSRAPAAGWGASLLEESHAGTKAAAGACPECGAALDAGAVLCVNCGYVLRAGKHITPEVIVEEGDEPESLPVHSPQVIRVRRVVVEEDRHSDGELATKWPTVIGVFSIIFAVFGALVYGFFAIAVAVTPPAEAGGPLLWAAGLVLYAIMFGLSAGLGVLAIGLLGRREFAPVWLSYWAWSKIFVSVVYAIVGAINLYENTPEQFAALGAIFIALFVAISLIWLLFWPVFLLLWLRRRAIREEVAKWT